MVEPHPCFREPPPETQLWRYMDFTKFVSMLDSAALYFARMDKLGDRFEGTVSQPTLTAIRAAFADKNLTNLDELIDGVGKRGPDMTRKSTFVNCWHANVFESDAMWKIYVKENGIAVQSTFQRLKAGLAAVKETLYAGQVEYIDFRTEAMSLQNFFVPVVIKKKSFQHEIEVRAVWWDCQSFGELVAKRDIVEKPGVSFGVDLHRLIENIYISPNAAPWFAELVNSVLAKYGLNVKGVPSDL